MANFSNGTFEGELLDVAHRAARAAAGELLPRWRKVHQVSTKSTATDPVTEADVAAEKAIRHLLARERPLDAILGEEGGDTPGAGVGKGGARPSGLRWVVDPLDGTVNYMYGLPNFSVSVAVENSDETLAGVVLDPLTGSWYGATRNGPALFFPTGARSTGGEVIGRSDCPDLSQALVATGFAYDAAVRRAQGAIVARLLPRVRDIRRAGSAALDMAWTGAGHLDAYYERGVKAWDIAAGALICTCAGLEVRRLAAIAATDGSPELPEGVIVAAPELIDELEALITN
jgi:myo-inositol-1(or 4)-monophosphatase